FCLPSACNTTPHPDISTRPLHDALPILTGQDLGERLLIPCNMLRSGEDVFLDDMTVNELSEALNVEIVVTDEDGADLVSSVLDRSEEHTSELQSRFELVCRLLRDKKKA